MIRPGDERIPGGELNPLRNRLLETALAEWDAGVREIPPGSNRGPEVDKYIPAWAKQGPKGPAWCAFFVGWVSKVALGRFFAGKHWGACFRIREYAMKNGTWVPKGGAALPLPGDVFIMDTDGDAGNAGHTGYVLRVSENGAAINTVEGNTGHRVQLGMRYLSDPRILGWVTTVPGGSDADRVVRGLIPAKELGSAPTR